MDYTVNSLRKKLEETFYPGIRNVMNVSMGKYIENGIGFFPYGSGLLIDKENLPQNGIMILGQDFGTVKYLTADVLKNGEINSKTYVNVKKILPKEKEGKVFLTNLFIGLRIFAGMSGKNPSLLKKSFEKPYIELCFNFFEEQLKFTNPSKIIVLGRVPYSELLKKYGKNDFTTFKYFDYNVDKYININGEKYKIIPIPHPSMWNSNLKRSKEELTENIFYS